MSVNPKQTNHRLSDFERGQVVAYRDCNLSMKEICKRVHRSYYAVNTVIKEHSEQNTQEQEPEIKQEIKQEKRKSYKFSDRFSTRIKLSLTRDPDQPLTYHHEQLRMEGFNVPLSTLEAFVKDLGYGRSSSSTSPA